MIRTLLFSLSILFSINLYSQTSWNGLKKYVGTYSKETDFFKNEIVQKELKRILGKDYKSYREFVSYAGCGEIEYQYGLIYGDVSQLHIGGYNSIFFINIHEKKMYLFWLTGSVIEWQYKIYGNRPIPVNVLNIISENMNTGWGHVASFRVDKDSIFMDKN